MKNYQFFKLLKRYLKNRSSLGEQSLIEGWYNYFAKQQKVDLPEIDQVESDLDSVWAKLSSKVDNKSVKIVFPFRRVAVYAASIVLLLSVGIWFYFSNSSNHDNQAIVHSPIKSEINTIIDDYDVFVQMQSGDRLNLDDLSLGEMVAQERVSFHKNSQGELVYKPKVSEWEQPTVANKQHTLYVPKSKRSTIVLSDGTKVWLNSASSITFPEVFANNERVVEITGEAFFAVKKDVLKPFYVKTKGEVIKVVGTTFNVSAYDDEPFLTTTLVTGVVSILESQHASKPSLTLSPGQQWSVNKATRRGNLSQVDATDILSWREGKISFVNLDLKSIMRKVSRFYDVEVEYQSDNYNQSFTGGITTKTTLEEFIRIMSVYDIKIQKKGNKLLLSN